MALVGIIMGSTSDWPVLRGAAEVLDELGVAHEARVVSAHRTPDRLWDYATGAEARGLKVIVAGAGGAAHLPGMTASKTRLPVIGVPVPTRALGGLDSLLSIVQMPRGTPVATMAIGEAGAVNAGLMAAAILALGDAALGERLDTWRRRMADAVPLEPGDSAAAPKARAFGAIPAGDATPARSATPARGTPAPEPPRSGAGPA